MIEFVQIATSVTVVFLAVKTAGLYRRLWDIENRLNTMEDWNNLVPYERPTLKHGK